MLNTHSSRRALPRAVYTVAPRHSSALHRRRLGRLSRAFRRTAPRDGRLLVECLIATLLLDATAIVVATLSVATLSGTQYTRATTQAWGVAAQQLERAASASCDATPASGAQRRDGLSVLWAEQGSGLARDRALTIDVEQSPLRRLPRASLAVHATRICP